MSCGGHDKRKLLPELRRRNGEMTMDEYIKRESAFDAICAQYCASSDETEAALGDAMEMIRNTPAEDDRPVIHGKNVGEDYAECDQFVCSECGIELQDWHGVEHDEGGDIRCYEYEFNFCPNCGADLRVTENE